MNKQRSRYEREFYMRHVPAHKTMLWKSDSYRCRLVVMKSLDGKKWKAGWQPFCGDGFSKEDLIPASWVIMNIHEMEKLEGFGLLSLRLSLIAEDESREVVSAIENLLIQLGLVVGFYKKIPVIRFRPKCLWRTDCIGENEKKELIFGKKRRDTCIDTK